MTGWLAASTWRRGAPSDSSRSRSASVVTATPCGPKGSRTASSPVILSGPYYASTFHRLRDDLLRTGLDSRATVHGDVVAKRVVQPPARQVWLAHPPADVLPGGQHDGRSHLLRAHALSRARQGG